MSKARFRAGLAKCIRLFKQRKKKIADGLEPLAFEFICPVMT